MERGAGSALATFFAEEELAPGRVISLGEAEAHHARVRRLAPGASVRLTDGAGTMASGVLVRMSRAQASVEVVRAETVERAAPVHLLLPVADRERMLWLAEKATELAITSWRPVLWRRSRSVAPRGEGTAFRAKVRARMTAALTQSGGAWLPDVHPDAPPERAIAAAPVGARYLLDAAGGPMPEVGSVPVVIAVGPEGGVEPEERARLVAAGFVPVQVAPLTLRFETAAIAALGALSALRPRLGGCARVATNDASGSSPQMPGALCTLEETDA